ncbi:FMN-dependent NADH-azoreductase [Hyphococcus sp. DH-69]|uniref:FMN-dependent NADH-azoreductase n=1 Tax=Hyphococcus formosus TaxID=3143534 RepID=UPI00398AE20F
MDTVLVIDGSARTYGSDIASFGSHTRRISHLFAETWRSQRPEDLILHREVGAVPPSPVDADWVHAAFTPAEERTFWMQQRLAESDKLVDELIAADVIVVAAPMYNFGLPAQIKAYVDNVVRVGRTFGFDRSRDGEPYWPLLEGQNKKLVTIASRGDFGYDDRLKHMNNVETGIEIPFSYIGITDHYRIAVEYDEFADERLQASIKRAEENTKDLVATLIAA